MKSSFLWGQGGGSGDGSGDGCDGGGNDDRGVPSHDFQMTLRKIAKDDEDDDLAYTRKARDVPKSCVMSARGCMCEFAMPGREDLSVLACFSAFFHHH